MPHFASKINMAGMMGINVTKEELLQMNERLNQIKKE